MTKGTGGIDWMMGRTGFLEMRSIPRNVRIMTSGLKVTALHNQFFFAKAAHCSRCTSMVTAKPPILRIWPAGPPINREGFARASKLRIGRLVFKRLAGQSSTQRRFGGSWWDHEAGAKRGRSYKITSRAETTKVMRWAHRFMPDGPPTTWGPPSSVADSNAEIAGGSGDCLRRGGDAESSRHSVERPMNVVAITTHLTGGTEYSIIFPPITGVRDRSKTHNGVQKRRLTNLESQRGPTRSLMTAPPVRSLRSHNCSLFTAAAARLVWRAKRFAGRMTKNLVGAALIGFPGKD